MFAAGQLERAGRAGAMNEEASFLLAEDDVTGALPANLRNDGGCRLLFDGDRTALPACEPLRMSVERERFAGAIGDGVDGGEHAARESDTHAISARERSREVRCHEGLARPDSRWPWSVPIH